MGALEGALISNFSAILSALSVILGAVIGGSYSFIICFYNLKIQTEKELKAIRDENLTLVFDQLLAPFLEHTYRLNAKNDGKEIDEILGILRKERKYFAYCPQELRNHFIALYSILEKNIENKKDDWDPDFKIKIKDEVNEIEQLISNKLLNLEI
jgi:hypothetical protein